MEKQQILDSFLKISSKGGINNDILSIIARDCSITESKINLLFEEGIVGIIDFYLNEKLIELTNLVRLDKDFEDKKVREKIYFCLFNFFILQKEHRESIKAIKSFYFDLGNLTDKKNGLTPAVFAIKSTYRIADKIWILLHDQSTDYNYYTKRLTLSKVIIKTFFVFINDESADLSKTSDTISKEIENVMKFEKLKREVKNFCGKSQEEIARIIYSDDGGPKPISEIVKNLPFIRLFN